MIRAFQDSDLDAVMSIWLSANLEAHDFVDPEYWRSHFNAVRTMILQAEIYISEDNHRINGFIGVMDSYIAGIFVDRSARTCGIGSQLLDFVKKDRERLTLNVYKRNTSALSFYFNRGFQIDTERMDPQTSEIEYTMSWKR